MIANNTISTHGPTLLRELALRANRGIHLERTGNHHLFAKPLTVEGEPDPAVQAVSLPRIPVKLLEQGAGFLRHIWRVRQASAVLWFYMHPQKGQWVSHCPPQLCCGSKVEADALFKNCETPDPDLWLAGSLRSVPPGVVDQPGSVEPLLPLYQGVHFVLDLGRSLTSLMAYVRCEDALHSWPAESLIDDQFDPSLAHLSDRLLFCVSTTR